MSLAAAAMANAVLARYGKMAPRLVMYLAETSIAENPKVLGRSGEVARAAAHRGSRQGRSRLPGTTSSAVPVAGEHLRVELRLSARHRDLELPQGAPPCRAAPRDRGSSRGRAPCEDKAPSTGARTLTIACRCPQVTRSAHSGDLGHPFRLKPATRSG